MSNLWDDDSNEEFRDIPDEAKLDKNNQPMQAPPVRVQTQVAQPQTARAPQPYRPPNIPAEPEFKRDAPLRAGVNQEIDVEGLNEYMDQSLGRDYEEDDFTEVLNDANLRIEQGRLYQMIMNHELFEGMEADPRAVQNVQREIRKFARESMEVMLGMRETTPVHAAIASPFNDLEVDILKKLASRATNGATETPEANQVASVLKEAPRRKTLNPIGGSKKTAVAPTKQPQKQAQRLQFQPSAPLKRAKLDMTIDQICAEEGVPRELLEEHYKPLGKPLQELSGDEATKRAKETADRLRSRVTVKSASALPMATPEQEEMLAMQRAQQVATGPGMAAILDKVNKMPKSLNVE